VIQINTEVIKKLNPCNEPWQKWLIDYPDFDGDIVEFLELEKVKPHDKIWVAVRLMPRFLVEVFAIDCAVAAYASAYAYASASYASASAFYAAASSASSAAASAAYAAASEYAVYTAAYTVASASSSATSLQERENQVDALIMLCEDL